MSDKAALRGPLTENADVSRRPLINLATRSVNGANVMKLGNRDAQALYESAGALYLAIEGTTQGSPKTAFSDAIPLTPWTSLIPSRSTQGTRQVRWYTPSINCWGVGAIPS